MEQMLHTVILTRANCQLPSQFTSQFLCEQYFKALCCDNF